MSSNQLEESNDCAAENGKAGTDQVSFTTSTFDTSSNSAQTERAVKQAFESDTQNKSCDQETENSNEDGLSCVFTTTSDTQSSREAQQVEKPTATSGSGTEKSYEDWLSGTFTATSDTQSCRGTQPLPIDIGQSNQPTPGVPTAAALPNTTDGKSSEAMPGPNNEETGIKTDSFKHRSKSGSYFPEKLYQLMMDAEAEGREDIVSFTPSGCAIQIHDPEKFINELVPRYFRQKKIDSFKRQLMLWGFVRINRGPEEGAHSHKYFQRGHPELLKMIKRDPSSRTAWEPDFSTLPDPG